MTFFDTVWNYIKLITIIDVIDISIVAFAIYKIIAYARATRVSQLFKGILVILIIMQISSISHLHAVSYILQNMMQFGFLALIVVFQPELRRALESVGTRKWGRIPFFDKDDGERKAKTEQMIDSVCKAVSRMSLQHVGALIVFERLTIIEEIIKTGIRLDAVPSQELFLNIFYPKAALHDGAVIIRDNRVISAGCILPLSQQRGINKELGTRHRAALGISETSDCVVVVVSEENGMISFVRGGALSRNVTIEKMSEYLRSALIMSDTENTKRKAFWESFSNTDKKEKEREKLEKDQ